MKPMRFQVGRGGGQRTGLEAASVCPQVAGGAGRVQSRPALLVWEMDTGRALPQTEQRSTGQGRVFSSTAPSEVMARTAGGAGQPGTQGRPQLICLEVCPVSVWYRAQLRPSTRTRSMEGGRQACAVAASRAPGPLGPLKFLSAGGWGRFSCFQRTVDLTSVLEAASRCILLQSWPSQGQETLMGPGLGFLIPAMGITLPGQALSRDKGQGGLHEGAPAGGRGSGEAGPGFTL